MVDIVMLAIIGIWIVGIYAGVALGVKRLHDFGAGGGWMFFNFVPIANLILAVALVFRSGKRTENDYGPPR